MEENGRKPKPGKKRYRRTPAEMIEDLQQQIKELEKKKQAKQLKATPVGRQANTAYRALTKGIDMCEGAGDAELKRALSKSQRVLADHFESQGIKVPKARKPRARKNG